MPFNAQPLFPMSIPEDSQCISAAQLLQLPYFSLYPLLHFHLFQVFGKAWRKEYAWYECSQRVGGGGARICACNTATQLQGSQAGQKRLG